MDPLSDVSIAAAASEDAAALAGLLRAADLPVEDFSPHLAHFLVARQGDRLIGAVGAEVYGEAALLRSLVVAPEHRGRDLGAMLLRRLEQAAGAWGVQRWWLLTTTAEAFFRQHGFIVTARNAAPAAIATTAEFMDLCPATAVCLSRERRAK
ncbi:MAG TPA: amino acid acetyltransferase [Verrucomicrobiales bacterium]|nr:amino acid acetyltransferase [Verrucomicrobiales bacterium]